MRTWFNSHSRRIVAAVVLLDKAL